MVRRPQRATRTDTLFPYTALFRSHRGDGRFSPDRRMVCRWPTQVAPRIAGVVDAGRLLPNLAAGGVPPEVLSLVRSGLVLDPYIMPRSEEHTSELQSLMRISYAVFCLKKKTTHTKLALIHT